MRPVENMQDVRREIDRVDQIIVPLLLERLQYIKAAGRIKHDRDTVHDSQRIEDVIAKVKAEALRLNGDQDYIEDIYRHLIDWSINHEFTVWDSKE